MRHFFYINTNIKKKIDINWDWSRGYSTFRLHRTLCIFCVEENSNFIKRISVVCFHLWIMFFCICLLYYNKILFNALQNRMSSKTNSIYLLEKLQIEWSHFYFIYMTKFIENLWQILYETDFIVRLKRKHIPQNKNRKKETQMINLSSIYTCRRTDSNECSWGANWDHWR